MKEVVEAKRGGTKRKMGEEENEEPNGKKRKVEIEEIEPEDKIEKKEPPFEIKEDEPEILSSPIFRLRSELYQSRDIKLSSISGSSSLISNGGSFFSILSSGSISSISTFLFFPLGFSFFSSPIFLFVPPLLASTTSFISSSFSSSFWRTYTVLTTFVYLTPDLVETSSFISSLVSSTATFLDFSGSTSSSFTSSPSFAFSVSSFSKTTLSSSPFSSAIFSSAIFFFSSSSFFFF